MDTDRFSKFEPLYRRGYFDARAASEDQRKLMYSQEFQRLCDITHLEHGRVLDVGCGLGGFLSLFDERRWQRFGIEISQHCKEACHTQGISFEVPDQPDYFDLIVFRGTLQHLPNSLEMLFEAHRRLRPGGWFVALATPNAGSLVYRIWQQLPALAPELNFVVYSDTMLRQCLKNIGFKEPRFHFPYLGTPHARPVRDHLMFLASIAAGRRDFAFWGNMMECYAQK